MCNNRKCEVSTDLCCFCLDKSTEQISIGFIIGFEYTTNYCKGCRYQTDICGNKKDDEKMTYQMTKQDYWQRKINEDKTTENNEIEVFTFNDDELKELNKLVLVFEEREIYDDIHVSSILLNLN